MSVTLIHHFLSHIIGAIYQRLVHAVEAIGKDVAFSRHDRFGFLTFCPSNLGTTIRASVHIKLPNLGSNRAKLEEEAAKFNLQVRGTRGEHTDSEGGVFDISNKRRLGLTEFDAVSEMYNGIKQLIDLEKSTEPGEAPPADDSAPAEDDSAEQPAEWNAEPDQIIWQTLIYQIPKSLKL